MVGRRRGCFSAEEWLARSGPMGWRQVFPGLPEEARNARRLVETLFAGTPRKDDLGLIVSELLNNSILYTDSGRPGGWVGVECRMGDLAYLAVTDLGGAGVPTLRPSPVADLELRLGGRGLGIVSDLSVSIGIHGSPAIGHTVWADVDLRACESGPAPEEASDAVRLVS